VPGQIDNQQPLDHFRERLEPLIRYAQVGRTVSSVTHDLNNYLGAILAYSELLELAANIDANAKRMLGNIGESVRKCSSLISGITSVARLEKPDANVVDIAQFIDNVLDMRRYDYKVARVPLETGLKPGMPSIVIDRPKLTMALLYLLANALEAVPETEDYRVIVSATDTPEGIAITVRDSGEPIPQEIRAQMFQPFYTTKTGLHLGLGLPMAAAIAQYHGGALGYEPTTGFTITLPRETPLRALA
jgi:signal transduction histidine kinase